MSIIKKSLAIIILGATVHQQATHSMEILGIMAIASLGGASIIAAVQGGIRGIDHFLGRDKPEEPAPVAPVATPIPTPPPPAPTPVPPPPPVAVPAPEPELDYSLLPVRKWISHNKELVIVSSIALVYIIILRQLFKAQNLLQEERRWANWHDAVSEEAMISKDQVVLSAEIVKAIQIHYLLPASSTQGIDLFLKDTEQELQQLKSFISLREWLSFFMLDLLFPAQEEVIKKARSKIIKLQYLRQLMLNQKLTLAATAS